MRIAVCYLGVVVVFTALGCQPKSDKITSGETVSEPSTVTQQKSAISVANAEPESTVTEAAQHSESGDDEHGGRMGRGPGGMGRGPGGMGRGPGGMGRGPGRGPARWRECKAT